MKRIYFICKDSKLGSHQTKPGLLQDIQSELILGLQQTFKITIQSTYPEWGVH